MHGLFTPSAVFFRNTTTLKKIAPNRAKTRMGTVPDSRTLNPFVSFEERHVVKVSVPDYTLKTGAGSSRVFRFLCVRFTLNPKSALSLLSFTARNISLPPSTMRAL